MYYMAQFGKMTSLYLQNAAVPKIDLILERHIETFKSRNQFINCAIAKELRRYKPDGELYKSEEKP